MDRCLERQEKARPICVMLFLDRIRDRSRQRFPVADLRFHSFVTGCKLIRGNEDSMKLLPIEPITKEMYLCFKCSTFSHSKGLSGFADTPREPRDQPEGQQSQGKRSQQGIATGLTSRLGSEIRILDRQYSSRSVAELWVVERSGSNRINFE